MNNPFTKSLINIGGDSNDGFYRYKMPAIETSFMNKNGGTTVISNIETIAKSLKRSPNELCKYLNKKMACNGRIIKGKGMMIVGSWDKEELQNKLTNYIKLYILCYSCDNPETIIEIKKTKSIMTCSACGKTNELKH